MLTRAHKTTIALELKHHSKETSPQIVSFKSSVSYVMIKRIIDGLDQKRWENVKDIDWKRIASTLKIDPTWNVAKTDNFRELYYHCKTAKKESISLAISATAGKGKSQTYQKFARENKNVIYIQCENTWSNKKYHQELVKSTGKTANGTNQNLLTRFILHLKTLEEPLVIIDQFDKLKDSQMNVYMDLYNNLNGYCGFIISGVKALEKRIFNGVAREKMGFEEMFSRFGRKFIDLDPITIKDVELICEANGVDDKSFHRYVYESCEDDIRRIVREVKVYKLKEKII